MKRAFGTSGCPWFGLAFGRGLLWHACQVEKTMQSSKNVLDFFKTVWHGDLVDSCYMCTCAHLEPAGLANKRDVVILTSKHRVGEVWLFAEINKECVALISFWSLHDKKATHSIWNV